LQPTGNLNRSVALLQDLDGAAIRHRDEERNAIPVSRELHDLDSQSPKFIRVGKYTLLGSQRSFGRLGREMAGLGSGRARL